MNQEQLYERTYGTTLQQAVEEPLQPAANEGLLARSAPWAVSPRRPASTA